MRVYHTYVSTYLIARVVCRRTLSPICCSSKATTRLFHVWDMTHAHIHVWDMTHVCDVTHLLRDNVCVCVCERVCVHARQIHSCVGDDTLIRGT